MTTVYVVTTGSYSDYRINAVFSTPELAQTYIEDIGISEGDYHVYVGEKRII